MFAARWWLMALLVASLAGSGCCSMCDSAWCHRYDHPTQVSPVSGYPGACCPCPQPCCPAPAPTVQRAYTTPPPPPPLPPCGCAY